MMRGRVRNALTVAGRPCPLGQARDDAPLTPLKHRLHGEIVCVDKVLIN
jgi:hypothetical protein